MLWHFSKNSFNTNIFSQASRAASSWLFSAGLGLIGFGLLIYLLPELFATIAAVLFFIGGMGLITAAIKIFLAQRRFSKMGQDNQDDGRENVSIHRDEFHDM